MAKPADTYSKSAQTTGNPRELEAQLLMRAAAKLQAVKDGTSTLIERLNALRYNRRLWLVFADSVTSPDSQLPREIRQNVANLAIFVTKQTMSIETEREPELDRLGILININCEIAAGLRANAA
jgi:flagellar protein FlaF